MILNVVLLVAAGLLITAGTYLLVGVGAALIIGGLLLFFAELLTWEPTKQNEQVTK